MRHHIYLACVELTFVDKDGQTGVTRANTMIRAAKQQVGLELLARAQQGAQIQLIEQLQEPELTILNAVFTGMMYLGHMTDAEFNKRQPIAAGQQSDPSVDKLFESGSSLGIQDN